jgi:hypothetical protein
MAELEGPDASIEISLKEYGLAWKIGETETRFYFGIRRDGAEYTRFDFADVENDTDTERDFDWASFQEVADFVGMPLEEWEKMPLTQKINDLLAYHGYENIFGAATSEMTYREVIDAGTGCQTEKAEG